MLRRYETIFIVRSDLQSDEMNSLIDRYAGVIVSLDGKTIKVENWGKRRLAYPIEKMQDGVYVRIDFVAQHKVVIEIERKFKIDDNVLRFQTVKLSDKVNLEEIEREIADTLKKEEERKKEEQRKEEQRKEEQEKEEQEKEEQEKEELVPEPVVSEVVAEEPDSKEVETDDKEVVQETPSVETDEKKAEEE
ncbi:MAG: 30S ribosomal protein S6 [Syntrophobacterales bacterium]|nr:30S ribosomal protein S6 [Syntrophobacterales bacterium]